MEKDDQIDSTLQFWSPLMPSQLELHTLLHITPLLSYCSLLSYCYTVLYCSAPSHCHCTYVRTFAPHCLCICTITVVRTITNVRTISLKGRGRSLPQRRWLIHSHEHPNCSPREWRRHIRRGQLWVQGLGWTPLCQCLSCRSFRWYEYINVSCINLFNLYSNIANALPLFYFLNMLFFIFLLYYFHFLILINIFQDVNPLGFLWWEVSCRVITVKSCPGKDLFLLPLFLPTYDLSFPFTVK